MLTCRHFYPHIHDGNIVLAFDAQLSCTQWAVLTGMQKPSDTFIPVNFTLNSSSAMFASIFYLVD